MQVTTGQSAARVHLLFRIACFVGAVIGVATFLLIWSYRAMEMSDLREHDREVHQRLEGILIGTPERQGELSEAKDSKARAYMLSRSLFGVRDSSARISCPPSTAPDGAAWSAGGAPLDARALKGALGLPGAPQGELFLDRDGDLVHMSARAGSIGAQGACLLEIFTDLGEEVRRIDARSYQIALSSAILEGLLVLSLLWIARRGDERLIESEKEQSAMESELYFLAHYDTLTHLPNRSLFWERLDASIGRAERLGKSVCLVLVDIRGFSKINEDFGRTIGDRALVEAARRIQAAARSSDLVCRMGPDEFSILLEDLEPERTDDAAGRLALALERHFADPWPEPIGSIRANCGAAQYPHDGVKSEDLLACAQAAAKSAKDSDIHLAFHEAEARG